MEKELCASQVAIHMYEVAETQATSLVLSALALTMRWKLLAQNGQPTVKRLHRCCCRLPRVQHRFSEREGGTANLRVSSGVSSLTHL